MGCTGAVMGDHSWASPPGRKGGREGWPGHAQHRHGTRSRAGHPAPSSSIPKKVRIFLLHPDESLGNVKWRVSRPWRSCKLFARLPRDRYEASV